MLNNLLPNGQLKLQDLVAQSLKKLPQTLLQSSYPF